MSLFDHYHILVNSTMQILHIAHNSVTTTWSGFITDYNDNWSIFQISKSDNIFSVIFYVILSYVIYTCMLCNMNMTMVLIITLLFKFPTVYLKPNITIESCICFPMITLVLDNVTYYYNILISAISIYLDKPGTTVTTGTRVRTRTRTRTRTRSQLSAGNFSPRIVLLPLIN